MSNKRHLRVGVACNIKTDDSSEQQAEFDEPETIAAICGALAEGGFEPFVLEASDGFPQKLESEKPDIVFNIAEGRLGRAREAQIPAILEYFGVPYTGSDAVALAVSLDKALTKRVAQSIGVVTPEYAVIKNDIARQSAGVPAGQIAGLPGDLPAEKSADLPIEQSTDLPSRLPADLHYPVIIKPNAEGSGMGISDACVAANPAELGALVGKMSENYGQDIIVEKFISGREFTVGILGNRLACRVFEPMEVIFKKQRGLFNVYNYEVKKNFRDYVVYSCPSDIPAHVRDRMMHDAEAVYEALGCRDFARIDFRLSEDGTVYFLELNPLPGLAPGYSDFPMLAEFNGIAYDDLICDMLRCALKRYGMDTVYA